jgi:S1-C subfamily serine protease
MHLLWLAVLVAGGLLGLPGRLAAREVGWLGISIGEITEDLAERLAATFGPAAGNGVQVVEVLQAAPSERVLQRGDVIVQVERQPIWDVRQLQRIIRALDPGRQVSLEVLRGARRVALAVTVGPMPAESRAQLAAERFGFLVREREQPARGPALVIAMVEPDSPAAKADLRPLDRIVQANGQAVDRLPDFERAVGSAAALALTLQRGDAPPVTLRLESPRHPE